MQVAASAVKDNVAPVGSTKNITAASTRDARSVVQGVNHANSNVHTALNQMQSSETKHTSSQSETSNRATGKALQDTRSTQEQDQNLVEAVEALNVHESKTPSLIVNGTGAYVESISLEGILEDRFRRTDSDSELGTKPPSLDGKSTASGTTFALDEKESLRPDDSASVKAAEDDDTFSGRGSIVAGSRIGSEAAAKAYRSQFYDTSDRRAVPPSQDIPVPDATTSLSGSSGQLIASGMALPIHGASSGGPDGFGLFYRQAPDDKLLEALESPKDRMFLLRLEQDVIAFVKDSKYVLTSSTHAAS